MESSGCSSARRRMKQDPMKPAPPVTRIRMEWDHPGTELFVLQLPVVIDIRVVVRNSTLIRRIIEAIREVDQQSGFGAQHLIPVSHTGRNAQLPGTQRADVIQANFASRFSGANGQ